MRQLLRAIWMTVRGVLWIIKGLLLTLALLVLVLWPVSRNRSFEAQANRSTSSPAGGQLLTLHAECARCRVAFSRTVSITTGESTKDPVRREEVIHPPGWSGHVSIIRIAYWGTPWLGGHGSLDWFVRHAQTKGAVEQASSLTIPCWLGAILLAAWPLISLGLLLHRNDKKRQRIRNGFDDPTRVH